MEDFDKPSALSAGNIQDRQGILQLRQVRVHYKFGGPESTLPPFRQFRCDTQHCLFLWLIYGSTRRSSSYTATSGLPHFADVT